MRALEDGAIELFRAQPDVEDLWPLDRCQQVDGRLNRLLERRKMIGDQGSKRRIGLDAVAPETLALIFEPVVEIPVEVVLPC